MQACMLPFTAFFPAIAPVFTLPLTVPVKRQEAMRPLFTPAMPPTASVVPEMSSVPDTVRSRTAPLVPITPNSPAREYLPSRSR